MKRYRFIYSMLTILLIFTRLDAQPVPDVTVDPASIEAYLVSGEIENHNVALWNSGDPVDFLIDIDITLEPGDGGGRIAPNRDNRSGRSIVLAGPRRFVDLQPMVEVPDEAVMAAVKHGSATAEEIEIWNRYMEDLERFNGNPGRDVRGEPDDYGYIWRDDDEKLTVYDWVDITGIGTRQNNVTDDWISGDLNLGWSFNFYGNDFSTLRICSNGFVSFTSGSRSWTPFELPRAAQPVNLLAVQWMDLEPTQGGDIYFYTDANDEIAIVSWIDIPRYGAGAGTEQTFQLIINGDNVIKYQYADDNPPEGNSCIGIQNANGSDGLSIHFGNEEGGPAGRAYSIMRSWIRTDPTEGSLDTDQGLDITVTLDATWLIEGQYEAEVHVLSDDQNTPDVVVDVSMFVDGEQDIATEWSDNLGFPDEIDWNGGFFPDIILGVPYEVQLTVRNIGTDDLIVDEITTDNEVFSIDQDNFMIDPRDKAILRVTLQSQRVGEHQGILTLNSDDPDQGVFEIPLYGVVSLPPVIDFDPPSILKKLDVDELSDVNIAVRNIGEESTLRFGAEVEIISEPDGGGGRVARNVGPVMHREQDIAYQGFVQHRNIEVPDEAVQMAVKRGVATERERIIWNRYLTELEEITDMPRRDAYGGLDNYGYIWRDEDEGLVEFNWIDITGIGSELQNVDDDWNSGNLNMDWTFNFYGQDFNTIRVCSNGWASFTSTSTSYTPFQVPNDAEPFNLLAPQWCDLNPVQGGSIYFYTDAGEEQTIISWIGIPRYNGGDGTLQTFQLILSGDGSVKFQYNDDNAVGRISSIGIQNDDGTDGLSIYYANDDGGTSGTAYLIRRSWVRLDPFAGEIDPGDRLDITATLDGTGLIDGVYEADLIFHCNDPENPDMRLNVILGIGQGSGIVVTPEAVDFGELDLGTISFATVEIENISELDLTIDRIETVGECFSDNLGDVDNFVLQPGEMRSVIVNFRPTSAQGYNGGLEIDSDDPDLGAITVGLTGLGIGVLQDISLGYLPGEKPDIVFARHFVDENFDGASQVFAVDMDDDGDTDVFATAYDGDDIAWWENDSDENFTEHTIQGDFDGAISIYAIDMDDDGDVDILGAAAENNEIKWWKNNGGENFTGHTISADFNQPYSVHAIDIDLDGDIDVLGASYADNEITLWENNGYEEFTEQNIVNDFGGAICVFGADIDNDGDVDILAAAYDNDDITWWENNGDHQFTEHLIDGDFTGASSVYAADLDSDGDVDLLATAQDADEIVWYENDGAQNFSLSVLSDSFDGARSVYSADVDDDGDVDIVGSSTDSGEIRWWENVGDGNFSEYLIDGEVDGAESVYAKDVDSDGDIDVLGVAFNTDDVIWWENTHLFGYDFGQVEVDSSAEWTFTVSNRGSEVLNVSSIQSSNAVYVTDFGGNVDINPGASIEVTVTFSPDAYELFNATLEIDSNDPDEATIQVALNGEGIYVNYPPVVDVEIPDYELDEDFNPFFVAELDTIFSDPNGDVLSFSVVSDHEEIGITVSGGIRLRITSVARDWYGEAVITVTADDGYEGGGSPRLRDFGPLRRLRTIGGDMGDDEAVNPSAVDSWRTVNSRARSLRSVDNADSRTSGAASLARVNNDTPILRHHDTPIPRRDDQTDLVFNILVNPVNDRPRWDVVPDTVVVNEAQELSFTVEASDVDTEEITLTAVSNDLPDGWNFVDNSDGTGSFTWIPGYDDSGEYLLSLNVTDGEYNAGRDVVIRVIHVNRNLEWVTVPDSVGTDEGVELTFNVEASDPDGDELTLTAESLDLPEGWQFADNGNGTGSFTWTPEYYASGEYILTVRVTDGEYIVVEDVKITVIHVNLPPTWIDVPESVAVDEGVELSFTVEASDFDGDEIALNASSNDLPGNWDFTDNGGGTGSFTWTPGFEDSGEYTLILTVSDAEFDVDEDVIITVNHTNRTPVWDDIPESISGDENTELSFNVSASDPDGDGLSIDASSNDLPGGWNFNDNGDGTGGFSWTPGYDDSGDYSLTLTVSDGGIAVPHVVAINVVHVNRAPVWSDIPASVEVNEAAELTFNVTASDPDGDDIILEAASGDLPGGWNFTDNDDGTGNFTWTPGYNDSGEYTLTCTVSDAEFDVDEAVTIIVNNVNRAPVWIDIPESVSVNEAEELSFMVEASDPDGDDLSINAESDDLPDGWQFNDNGNGTGVFTWTPTYDESGNYLVTFTLSDAEFNVAADVSITVNDVNRTPVWDDIPQSVNIGEGELLEFSVSGSDPDGDELDIEVTSGDLPNGWNFSDNGNGTGDFSWRPGFDEEGAYLAVFTISDAEFAVEAEVIITVGDVNLPPIWDDVPNAVAVNEDVELVISVVGSDPDGNDISIVYSSNDIPEAADFTDHTDGTGTFIWTPTYDEAGVYTATFTISDDEFNVATNVTITVNDVNRSPVWDDVPETAAVDETVELSFTVSGSDPDGDELMILYSSGDIPEAADFTDNGDGTGTFTWTPGYDDSGVYTATFTLSDNDIEVPVDVEITVNNVNRQPVWDDVPEQVAIDENQQLQFNVTGSDPDGDDLTIVYSSNDITETADFTDHTDGTGTFTWTPTYDDAGVYTATFTISDDEFNVAVEVQITVNHVNRSPVWDDVPEQVAVNENQQLQFNVTGSDPDGDDLDLTAVSDNLPEGWQFVDNEDGSGTFTWTPGYEDSGEYSVTFTVSDAGFNIEATVSITVNHVNRSPEWVDFPENVSVDEGSELAFTVVSSDADSDDLTIAAVSNDLPEGWVFRDVGNGRATFNWTPTFEEAGEYHVTFTVSDAEFDVAETVTITVNPVNRTPVWDDLPGNLEVDEAVELTFNVSASDPDNDDLIIEASASDNMPEGWNFTDYEDGSGRFVWTPSYDDTGEYALTLTVTDGDFRIAAEISITVNNVNRTPVWDEIPQSVNVGEGDLLEFSVSGSDPDGDELSISYTTDNLPEAAQFNDNGNGTGDFSWRPGFDEEGAYLAVFT
ncbi:tandem-95 repeat protein, partial [bacterium]|nr:tandem-95 repeat protein [bacterium]